MKKTILVIAFSFFLFSNVNAQEKSAKDKDAYALVELISKPTFTPIINQFMSLVKADKKEAFLKEVDGTFPELFNGLSKIYSDEFTHEEIKKLIKFYNSELGKKVASKQGLMAQKGMMLGQSWGMKMQDIVAKYQ